MYARMASSRSFRRSLRSNRAQFAQSRDFVMLSKLPLQYRWLKISVRELLPIVFSQDQSIETAKYWQHSSIFKIGDYVK